MMNSTIIKTVLLAWVVVTMTTACGFHLKGQRALPKEMQNVFLDYRRGLDVIQPVIIEEIQRSLRNRGGVVGRSPYTDATRLQVSHPRYQQRTQSVDLDGDTNEIEIVTTVTFGLYSGDGTMLINDTLVARRDYSFDPADALAQEEEARRLRESMGKELAELLLLRVEAQLSNPR